MEKATEISPFISAESISERVNELGQEIARTLPSGEILAIGVLKGAFVFMADLVRAIPRDVRCDFLTARSYGDTTETSGVVELASDLAAPIEGKHVLLIEDIIDTGLTLKYLLENLAARKPASLHVAALLSKPSRRQVDIRAEFTGFEVPDQFIVGYGLDAAQKYRHLPYLGVVKN